MESLSEVLAGESSGLKRFCALLDEECKVLTGAHADRLPDIAAEKASLAMQLSQLEKQRDALLGKSGFAIGRQGMAAWLASRPKSSADRGRWEEVQKLAAQARDKNQTNGRLINLLLKQNQEALSVLVSGGSESIYGADGQTRSLAAGKRSFGAV